MADNLDAALPLSVRNASGFSSPQTNLSLRLCLISGGVATLKKVLSEARGFPYGRRQSRDLVSTNAESLPRFRAGQNKKRTELTPVLTREFWETFLSLSSLSCHHQDYRVAGGTYVQCSDHHWLSLTNADVS